MKRRAFSFLELIFSIVIMGISFLSIPTIMVVMNRSTEATVDTKGYYHALAQMGIVMSKAWDENNVDDWDASNVVYILDTGTTTCNDDRNGTYEQAHRRQCDNNGTVQRTSTFAASLLNTFGKDGDLTNYNDIDDFHGAGQPGVEGNFDVNVSVGYVGYNQPQPNIFTIPQASGGGTTDIKQVSVRVTNEATGMDATLNYYGFNIGYDKLLTKEQ